MTRLTIENLTKDREHYVLDNLKLVHYVVLRFFHTKRYHQDYDDYYQEGCLGLVLAAIRFDESKGYKFSTYAIPYIAGHISRYIREVKPLIPYTRRAYEISVKIGKLLIEGLTDEQIIQRLNISPSKYYEIISAANPISLDAAILDTKECSDELKLRDDIRYDGDGFDLVNKSELADYLGDAISKVMKSLKRKYWDAYEEYLYGIYTNNRVRQDELAQKYGIGYGTLRMTITRTNKKLREILKEQGMTLEEWLCM